MEVANKDLCTELHELSGWEDAPSEYPSDGLRKLSSVSPAYDLGYLLRKLPRDTIYNNSKIPLKLEVQLSGGWWAHYGLYYWTHGDTPENALCKLAIELFKQGILKKEPSNVS